MLLPPPSSPNSLGFRRRRFSKVHCHEVWCPMGRGFMAEILKRRGLSHAWERQKLLAIMNPNKFRAAERLLRHHQVGGRVSALVNTPCPTPFLRHHHSLTFLPPLPPHAHTPRMAC